MSKKVVIIGGVAGGASTAARLRRNDEEAEIILFERGKYISFANCGLPYYVGNIIEERDSLLVQTPEAMRIRFNIDVRVENEVIKIDREKKEILVKDLRVGETYSESYDTLVLSPGSSPLKPPIPGINAPNIFTLWTVPDTDIIKDYIDRNKPKRAVVVGGGFIGIEMAENLEVSGLGVTLVDMADQVMAPLDYDMAQIVHQHLKEKRIKLYLKNSVKSFEYKDNITKVLLQSGTILEADMVILSIGVRANGELAKDAGLAVNNRGGIVVNEYLKTSDENIYAVGDAIEVTDFMSKGKTMIPLAGPANKQGRIVANNIVGANEQYKGTQGTSIVKIFDLTVAATGSNEKNLKRNGMEYGKNYNVAMTHIKSNAGYYPGALPMTVKLIFALDGKVLGAQIVGYEGVDKRIDVIATAIRVGATVYDLKELELAYAPPFSSAKDPVNMVGFIAENILLKKMNSIQWHELMDLDRKQTIILDVREQIERDFGFVEGSINIPLDELRDRLSELDKNKLIVIYCVIGLRGYIATRILMQNGFKKVKNFSGGYTTYKYMFCQNENNDNTYNDAGYGLDENIIDKKSIQGEIIKLNTCNLSCPKRIKKLYEKTQKMNKGDVLEIRAIDYGFIKDIKSFCKKTGNLLLDDGKRNREFFAIIKIM